jgi:hypothetical protein
VPPDYQTSKVFPQLLTSLIAMSVIICSTFQPRALRALWLHDRRYPLTEKGKHVRPIARAPRRDLRARRLAQPPAAASPACAPPPSAPLKFPIAGPLVTVDDMDLNPLGQFEDEFGLPEPWAAFQGAFAQTGFDSDLSIGFF